MISSAAQLKTSPQLPVLDVHVRSDNYNTDTAMTLMEQLLVCVRETVDFFSLSPQTVKEHIVCRHCIADRVLHHTPYIFPLSTVQEAVRNKEHYLRTLMENQLATPPR